MESAQFSEFSFGFAVTHELIVTSSARLTTAPVFPSLLREAKVGYDVQIRLGAPFTPLYLQFKLCQRPKRRPNGVTKAQLKSRFYRFQLRCDAPTGPSQHQRLCNHARAGRRVYYVAPTFSQVSSFNTHFRVHRILRNCVFVPPNWIGPLTSPPQHYVWYDKYGGLYRTSDPVKLPTSLTGEQVLKEIADELETGNRPVLDEVEAQHEFEEVTKLADFSDAERGHLLELVATQAPDSPTAVQFLRATSAFSSIYLGATMFLAQPGEN